MKTGQLLASVSLLLASSGCSLFFDLNANQCKVNADCENLGPQFSGTICVSQVCVAKAPVSMAGAGPDLGGNGGDSGDTGEGGSSGKAPSGGKGGKGGGGSGAGSAGKGDSGGAPPECTTNGDCIDAHVDQPYLCLDGSCVALTTNDCPELLPSTKTLDVLRTPKPIIIGGYANMNNTADTHDSQAVINWDLAISEFNDKTLGGIPQKGGGPARPVMALICQNSLSDTATTSTLLHLTEDVRVPAVISTLSADKLFSVFNTTQGKDYTGDPVLFLSTGSADLRLANLSDDGLVWHMLGDPHVLAATTVGLLNRIIPTVQAARTDTKTDPLRVTLVYSDEATMSDLFTVLTTADDAHPDTLLTFNGKSAISQIATGEFRTVKIESAKTHTTPDYSAAVTDLLAHPPHIVIAMATTEFPKNVIPSIENVWGNGGASDPTSKVGRPYYLASHLIYNTKELADVADQFSAVTPPLNTRLVGVNYSGAQDAHSKSLYDAYQTRLAASYQGDLQLAGTENFYDGAYSLLYALTGAYTARDTPDGGNIRDALEDRVFGVNQSSVDIGPLNVADTVSKLAAASSFKFSLWGTMGPPNFDRTTGTRVTATSAWCIQKVSTTWTYQADGLLYNPSTQTFTDNTAGVPDCLKGYTAP